MGSQKMLLPFGESTILETVIQNIRSSSVDSILVVLGANQEEILEVIKPLPVEVCAASHGRLGLQAAPRGSYRLEAEFTRAKPETGGPVFIFRRVQVRPS